MFIIILNSVNCLYLVKNNIMRNIKYIAIHCAATKPSMTVPIERVKKWHLKRGFSDVGYHFYIRRDGSVENGRDVGVSGAHVKGFNSVSIGICYEGGINEQGEPEDNRTDRQKASMLNLLQNLKKDYPDAEIKGHYQFPNVGKSCPCFDAKNEYKDVKYLDNEHR